MQSKREKYKSLLDQCKALVSWETDSLANMCNVLAVVHQTMGFLWTGVYRVADEMLVLGPFQGPVACTRIPYGRGVCGTCWEKNEAILVPDVDAFPGHIRCSSAARSEVVVPICSCGKVTGVLDIDSSCLGQEGGLDEADLEGLKAVAALLTI